MSAADRVPSLDEISEARRQLGERVRRTPVWHWQGRHLDQAIASSTEVHLKLELLQYACTFKPRAALLNMLELSPA
jgi:threonine dehydratase